MASRDQHHELGTNLSANTYSSWFIKGKTPKINIQSCTTNRSGNAVRNAVFPASGASDGARRWTLPSCSSSSAFPRLSCSYWTRCSSLLVTAIDAWRRAGRDVPWKRRMKFRTSCWWPPSCWWCSSSWGPQLTSQILLRRCPPGSYAFVWWILFDFYK